MSYYQNVGITRKFCIVLRSAPLNQKLCRYWTFAAIRYIVTNKRNSCTYLTSVICNRSYWKKFDIHSYLQPTVRLSPATAPFSQVCDRPIDRSTIQFYSHLLFVIMFCPYVPIIVFLSFAFFRCGSIHPFSPPLFPPVPISSCWMLLWFFFGRRRFMLLMVFTGGFFLLLWNDNADDDEHIPYNPTTTPPNILHNLRTLYDESLEENRKNYRIVLWEKTSHFSRGRILSFVQSVTIFMRDWQQYINEHFNIESTVVQ